MHFCAVCIGLQFGLVPYHTAFTIAVGTQPHLTIEGNYVDNAVDEIKTVHRFAATADATVNVARRHVRQW